MIAQNYKKEKKIFLTLLASPSKKRQLSIDKQVVFVYTGDEVSSDADWGWSKDPGPSRAWMFPAFFFEVVKLYE